MAEYHLTAPFSEEEIRKLRIGDTVYVSGKAFTCRSRLHRWIFDENHTLQEEALRRDLLIHVGPIVLAAQTSEEDGGTEEADKPQWELVSFMPTSSIRFEKWGAGSVREWGLRMIIGKTTMGEETMQAMRERGCVHVSPQSVSPNLWQESIRITGVDNLQDLGSIEATWYMDLTELGPFVVDMDTEGNNLYRNHEAEVDRNRAAALEKLGIPENYEFTKLY